MDNIQIPGMPKMIDNVNLRVRDDLEETITKKSKLRIAAACFSIYAYEELKKGLSGIENLKFIFTSPTFITEKAEKSRREFFIPRMTREQNLYAAELKEKFSSEYLSKQIELMLKMQNENPTDAIGKAKELIESCCKTILDNKGVKWDKNWDMGRLTGETLNLLNLTPKSISGTDPVSENIKAVLGNLRGISTKLAEIRNPYGSGHGKSASFTGLETRHAKLAVGCSITFVTFLWDTYEGGAS